MICMAVPGGPYRGAVLQNRAAGSKKQHHVNLSHSFVANNAVQALRVSILAQKMRHLTDVEGSITG